jgi:hypothetical protein
VITHQSRRIREDAPADHHEEHMTGQEPGDDEQSKHAVADSVEAKILQTLGELRSVLETVVGDSELLILTGKSSSITSINTKIKWPTRVW